MRDQMRAAKKNVFGEAPAPPGLDLTPLVDILSNLLFFLLAGVSSALVVAVEAKAPNAGPPAAKPPAVSLHLTGQGVDVGVAERAPRHVAWSADERALAECLEAIKKSAPEIDAAIVTADPGVRYEALIRVIDAAREHTIIEAGVPRRVALFSDVTISTPASANEGR